MSSSKISVSKNLVELARIFKSAGATLYIVGGFVRDSLRGKTPFDVDICSNLQTQQVKELLKKTNFKFKTKNSSFGTATISIDNESYEYTCFRTETYANDGTHTPIAIQFVQDIKTDAQRRDFYVNALYYDILNQQVLDPLGKGLENLNNKVLQVIKHEQCAFKEDAARILRLIKFSAMLGFEIAPGTLKLAKQHSILLEKITTARFKKELSFISTLSKAQQEKVTKLFLEIAPNLQDFS